jgi:hypothetical protein
MFDRPLGIAMGTIIGKVVPAMALIIPLFIIIRFLIIGLRPYYLPPQTMTWDYSGNIPTIAMEKDWIIGSEILDKTGEPDLTYAVYEICPPAGAVMIPPGQTVEFDPVYTCYRENGFSLLIKYQPFQRFWLFQFIESAVYLLLSYSLLGLALWWLKTKKA